MMQINKRIKTIKKHIKKKRKQKTIKTKITKQKKQQIPTYIPQTIATQVQSYNLTVIFDQNILNDIRSYISCICIYVCICMGIVVYLCEVVVVCVYM